MLPISSPNKRKKKKMQENGVYCSFKIVYKINTPSSNTSINENKFIFIFSIYQIFIIIIIIIFSI